ncbi:MAG: HlyD family type I secretion periplasmic adaptor subunit [Hyphomicrobium sp.]
MTRAQDDKKAAVGKLLEPQLRRRILLGMTLTISLVGSLFGWGALASISSAVIAPGLLVVDGSGKKVQHPTGGVVGAILVHNGVRVEAGDVLVRLDATQTRAALGVVTSQQEQLLGRKARLEAERDQAKSVNFPNGYAESSGEAAAIAASESRLYDARQTAKDGQKTQLNERIGQLRKEIEGLQSQLKAKVGEVKLMKEEFERVDDMYKKGLVPVTRALSAERDVTRLEGEHGQLVSSIARAEGQISEIGVQIISLDQSMQSESMKELREVEARLAELAERRNAAQDQLDRIDIRAPRSGLVHEMQIHTVGGVIQPAETLMTIVPIDEKLAVEIRIAPTDIDQVTIGHKAMLRFSAFNQRTTPELFGEVIQIAADLTKEPQTGIAYYVARLGISEQSQGLFRELKLLPGMPVETFIETGERTAISFLFKPFEDQIKRAFREE